MRENDIRRFLSKTTTLGPYDCWLWNGSVNKRGKDARFYYGRFSIGRKWHYAHRVAWEMAHGEPPGDSLVCHECDVPTCVNPRHLFLGDKISNGRDMAVKGRGGTGINHYTRRPGWTYAAVGRGSAAHSKGAHRGMHCGSAKRTDREIADLKWWAKIGVTESKILSLEYGLSTRAVREILSGKNWSHVEPSPIRLVSNFLER